MTENQKKFFDIIFNRNDSYTSETIADMMNMSSHIQLGYYLKYMKCFHRKNNSVFFTETFIKEITLKSLLLLFDTYIINNEYKNSFNIILENSSNEIIDIDKLDKKIQLLIYLHIALRNKHILIMDDKKISIKNIMPKQNNIIVELLFLNDNNKATITYYDLNELLNKDFKQFKTKDVFEKFEIINEIKNKKQILTFNNAKILENNNNTLVIEIE